MKAAAISDRTGKAADGTAIVLKFERKTCQDSMSGQAFEAAATLTVGDRSYEGCGNFRSDWQGRRRHGHRVEVRAKDLPGLDERPSVRGRRHAYRGRQEL